MRQKDAFYLLFVHDFGNGSLFRNQIDLVNELINTPASSFYINKSDQEEYGKAVSRLKAFISQLFSEGSKRTITTEFKKSLQLVLEKKILVAEYDIDRLVSEIILSLKEKNIGVKYQDSSSKRDIDSSNDFFRSLLDANYVSVFTAKEITIDYTLLNRNVSIVDLLIEDLFSALKNGKEIKKYRFNFPLEQTCTLFWRGLRQEIIRHLGENKEFLSSIVATLNSNKLIPFSLGKFNSLQIEAGEDLEYKIGSALLQILSKNNFVNVFHLRAPVYTASCIALNPNDPLKTGAYLLLQSNSGEDEIHKLTNQETFLWKFFVWESLKINNQSILIEYSASI